MKLLKIEMKPGLTVKLFREASTASKYGSYWVITYRKGLNNQWTETESFPSLRKLKHAEVFFNWALTRAS